ncbi:MAG: DUF433 domain-containing protein [Acidobacteriota bacterium]
MIDPNVCHGHACIKGTRIPISQILGMLANGDSIDELLTAYPSVELGDILACLDYAALLAEEQVSYRGTRAKRKDMGACSQKAWALK